MNANNQEASVRRLFATDAQYRDGLPAWRRREVV
jgi:hypothetical protein